MRNVKSYKFEIVSNPLQIDPQLWGSLPSSWWAGVGSFNFGSGLGNASDNFTRARELGLGKFSARARGSGSHLGLELGLARSLSSPITFQPQKNYLYPFFDIKREKKSIGSGFVAVFPCTFSLFHNSKGKNVHPRSQQKVAGVFSFLIVVYLSRRGIQEGFLLHFLVCSMLYNLSIRCCLLNKHK